VQTPDGLFSFGAVNGAGYDLVINGITLRAAGVYPVNLMTVYAHGQLFFRLTDGTWYAWTGNQLNTSSGPVSGPIPINVTFSAGSNPSIPAASSIGTLVTNVAVETSDGSTFAGVISLDNTSSMSVSGSSILTSVSPFTGGYIGVIARQNGSSFETPINVYTV